MFLQKWSKPLTMAALLVSGSLYAASNPAVEAKNGMVVTSQHRLAGRRGYPEDGRQRHRRRRGGGLCAGGG